MLLHELSLALAKALTAAGRRMATMAFAFQGREAQTAGWVLARGLDVLVSQDWPKAEGAAPVSLWPLNKGSAEATSGHVAHRCFDPLLRDLVWHARGVYAGRPHKDLDRLIPVLSDCLSGFLTDRCLDGGDLADCLAAPTAAAGDYFPQSRQAAAPVASTGSLRDDVRHLSIVIGPEDDGGEVKRKLVHLVRDDPWLHTEWQSFVEQRLRDQDDEERPDPAMETNRATDDFIFRATGLDGKTPIEVLLERQADMSDQQRQRLMRWDAETFSGAFLVRDVRAPMVDAVDLEMDRVLRLEATKPEALRSLRRGDLILSRAVPWDDHWLLSGVQQRHEQMPEGQVQQIRKSLRQMPSRRPLDPADPSLARAFEIQEEHYQAWLALFAKDEVLYADGLALGAAVNRFHRHWSETVVPATGLSRAEAFRRAHGREPPSQMLPLPDDLLKALDVAAIFDRRHGMSFLVGYSVFLSAFEGGGSLSDSQIERVWDYLASDSVEYWLFHRMAQRFPDRMEQVLRTVLKDASIRLQDLDALLRRFKGEAMRQPVRPMITVADPADVASSPGAMRP